MSRHWLADRRGHLAAIVVVFAALAAAVQVHCADLLSSDGEAYLRIAGYYAAGDLRHAVFGHWSPLGAWLSVPLVAAEMVPRYALRLWIGAWGLLCVVGVWRLAGRFEVGTWLRAAATACAALLIAELSAPHRVDLLLTALLLFYLDAAMDERVLTSRRWALVVGVLGGLAYLAKQYALPFFLAHVTLMLLLHGWASAGEARGDDDAPQRGGAWRPWRLMRAWVTAVGAFAVVAAPWVGVLSGKYGRLTFGTAGRSTLAQYGLDHAAGTRRPPVGLRTPPPDAPNVWHDATRDATGPPPDLPSPFASREAFGRYGLFVAGNVAVIAGHLAATDELRFALAALVLTPVAFVLTRRRRRAALRYAATGLTVVVFCGGYALVFADVRRYYWFAMLVLVVLAFHFAGLLPRLVARRVGEGRGRLLAVAVGVAAVVSFGFHPVRALGVLLGGPAPGRQHRLVAERVAEAGIDGPLACVGEDAWWNGLHVAYYLDAQYAGTPAAESPAPMAAEMREAGAATLLVWGRPALAAALRVQPGFEPALLIRAEAIAGLGDDVTVLRRPR